MTYLKNNKSLNLILIVVMFGLLSACGSISKPVDISKQEKSTTVEPMLISKDKNVTTKNESKAKDVSETEILELAEELIIQAKEKKDGISVFTKLAALSEESLFAALDTDEKKKAFWMNVYNATVQIFLSKKPELFDDRGAFFKDDRIVVAGKDLSLDQIEHGIIRGSKLKLSLGLIKDPFADSFERNTRVSKTDGRIHFALNCGAKSCPYVAIYDYKKVDEQLEKGAAQYLKKTTIVEGNTAKVSTLFNWFRGDFGSKQDIIDFNKRLGAIDKDAEVSNIEYLDYDWTLELGNFKEL